MPFNIKLLLLGLLLPMLLLAGCSSLWQQSKKEASTLKFHLEANPGPSERTGTASVGRARPVYITIELEPCIFETHIERASVVDTSDGGFVIVIKFTQLGAALLESITSAHRSRRLVIGSRFTEARWLGAQEILATNKSGTLIFTPDATRAETERIVRGLNNLLEAGRMK